MQTHAGPVHAASVSRFMHASALSIQRTLLSRCPPNSLALEFFLHFLLQALSPEGRGLMGTPCLGAECFCIRSSAQLLLAMFCSEKLVVRDLGANPSPKALLLWGVHQTYFW